MKSINWGYQQEPGPYTGGRSIYAPRGKTLGGSSSINGHIYNRGQRQDFDTWAQIGNRGWSFADVLPYFKRMEKRIGEGEDAYRGRDGSLTVTTMDWKDPLCEAFMEGAVSLGIPRNPGLQRRHPGRRLLRPAHHPERPARQRRDRVPAPRQQARQCRCAHACACDQHHLRGQARGRRALHQGRPRRHAGRGARAQGGDPAGGSYNSPQLLHCRASVRRNCCNRTASRCAMRCRA